jgi:predicted Zn-dependent peptidase
VNSDSDKPVSDLVSSYFGGSFGGRLMKKIRVEKGATYGVHGGFHPNRYAGEFAVGTFTKTSSTAETLKLVLDEIRGLIDRPPTAEELSLHRQFPNPAPG